MHEWMAESTDMLVPINQSIKQDDCGVSGSRGMFNVCGWLSPIKTSRQSASDWRVQTELCMWVSSAYRCPLFL